MDPRKGSKWSEKFEIFKSFNFEMNYEDNLFNNKNPYWLQVKDSRLTSTASDEFFDDMITWKEQIGSIRFNYENGELGPDIFEKRIMNFWR